MEVFKGRDVKGISGELFRRHLVDIGLGSHAADFERASVVDRADLPNPVSLGWTRAAPRAGNRDKQESDRANLVAIERIEAGFQTSHTLSF